MDCLGVNSGIYRNLVIVVMVELEFLGKFGYIINEGVCFLIENKVMF